jgi:membrane protein YdbS with pleckstrin-like domain
MLPEMTRLDLGEVDDSELSRAIWFWCRRPKLMFRDSAALMVVALCLLISLSIALVNWHLTSVPKRAAEVMIIVFEVAVEIYAIGYRLKFLRWRRDYEQSIDRLIRSLHSGV